MSHVHSAGGAHRTAPSTGWWVTSSGPICAAKIHPGRRAPPPPLQLRRRDRWQRHTSVPAGGVDV